VSGPSPNKNIYRIYQRFRRIIKMKTCAAMPCSGPQYKYM
jgi:hypothetical protein